MIAKLTCGWVYRGLLLAVLAATAGCRPAKQPMANGPAALPITRIVGEWERRTSLGMRLADGTSVLVERWRFAADGTVSFETSFASGEVSELRALGTNRSSTKKQGTYRIDGEASVTIQMPGEPEQKCSVRVTDYRLDLNQGTFYNGRQSSPPPKI